MTNPNNPNRSSNEPTNNYDDDPRSQYPGDPWERDGLEQDKPDATPISDPPDRGVDYYNQLIDLETCSYMYLKKGSMLQFTWRGEIHDIDEFEKALFRLYKSTYKSDLSAADLRPKAFQTFVDDTFSKQLKYTLEKKDPIEGPPGPRNQVRHDRVNERIAGILSNAAALACEHRAQLGRRAQPKDAVLKSILPEHVREQSA